MKIFLGIILILIVCGIWSIASVIVQDTEEEGVDAMFITYICNAMFVVLLLFANETNNNNKIQAIWISPVWMIAQGSYNLSLKLTSISSSTILSTTSSIWALIFGLFIFNTEQYKFIKLRIVGTLLSVIGATCVVLADDEYHKNQKQNNYHLLGDFFALFSAVLYGLYGAAVALYAQNSTLLFLGRMGLWNLTFFAIPLALYLFIFRGNDISKATGFTLSSHPPPICWVFFKALFDNLLSDFLYAKAVLFTTPTIATLGLSLTIPLAVLTDIFILHKTKINKNISFQLFGAILIIFGFFLTIQASSSLSSEYSQDEIEPQQQQLSFDQEQLCHQQNHSLLYLAVSRSPLVESFDNEELANSSASLIIHHSPSTACNNGIAPLQNSQNHVTTITTSSQQQ
uniref:EamA domain-containing protein n=1 Tax=Aureoumbra lagunensis TaxID=44058 RepID=A0A7S3JP17_9STRA|mmetsp:Transcript_8778/g.12210  ORF Transcript_8778/g.12210 Transcript_8778/m.12210 type:complete len:399 (+) Transcript_8778:201-1397(+)